MEGKKKKRKERKDEIEEINKQQDNYARSSCFSPFIQLSIAEGKVRWLSRRSKGKGNKGKREGVENVNSLFYFIFLPVDGK